MGDTSTGGTGPSADHTTGNGMKMLPLFYLPPLLLLKIDSYLFLRWNFIRKGWELKINGIR